MYYVNDPDLLARLENHKPDSLTTLRSEVVLLKSMIEQRLNSARTDAEKISAFNAVHPALSTLEKLVSSIHKLETQSSQSLSKEVALDLAREIGRLIVVEFNKADLPPGTRDRLVDSLSAKIAQAVSSATNG